MEIIQCKKNGNYTTQFKKKYTFQIENNLIQMQSN